ncbi:hypothetical protein PSEUDO8Z_30041 [Pseudomonas sp. 8Z]|nr:hypothetical protein PSEUDO8Z_30041 [Pseudomonas sp. 8Z]
MVLGRLLNHLCKCASGAALRLRRGDLGYIIPRFVKAGCTPSVQFGASPSSSEPGET